jgi:hypothetical protein
VSPDRKSDDVQRAVIDRITGEWAVLLVGDKEQERRVRASDLPDGADEGSIVDVRSTGLKLEVIATDDAATEAKRGEMKDRLSRLKNTRSSGRFDKPKPE